MMYIIVSFVLCFIAAACSLNLIVINKKLTSDIQTSDIKAAKRHELLLLAQLFNSIGVFLIIQMFAGKL